MVNKIKDIYLETREMMKNAEKFTTGFSDLDIFCKYIRAGNIVTIGARPSDG